MNRSRWRDLVLDVGQRARAEGRLTVSATDGSVLILGKGNEQRFGLTQAEVADAERARSVRVELLKKRRGDLGQRTVRVEGIWTGTGLTGASISSVSATDSTPAKAAIGDIGPVASMLRNSPRPAIEQQLVETGDLLACYRSIADGVEVWRAVVTDLRTVEAQLRPIYGSRLRVVQSRWTAADLKLAEEALIRCGSDVVLDLGSQIAGDGDMCVMGTLSTLSPQVARCLDGQDAAALELTVLVSPTHASV